MLVRTDGSISGSIGGGLMEAQVIEAAPGIIDQGRARLIHFDLMGDDAESAGMICGGVVDVYLELFSPEAPDDRTVAAELLGRAEQGLPTMVGLELTDALPRATRYLWSEGDAPDHPQGDWPEAMAKLRAANPAGKGRPFRRDDYFVEPLQAAPTVFLFGGGHVSAQIAPLAALVDFRVVVLDDRPEFASEARFPQADQVLVANLDRPEVIDGLNLGPWAYVVIVTRGHEMDRQVLDLTLRKPLAYLGMIGSRRKRNAIYDYLLKHGADQADIDRVYSPIGLDIKAETPEEIAVSIVAELIRVRAETAGGPGKNWKV